MTGRRLAGWIAAVVVSAAVLAAGVAGIVLDLERADKIASVVGAVAGLAGVAVSVAGLAASRRSGSPEQSVRGSIIGGRIVQRHDGGPGRQSVADSAVLGDVEQHRAD